jgi:hypothetical protein
MFKKGNDTRPAEFDHDDLAPPGHHWDEKTERFVPGPKPEPVVCSAPDWRRPLLRWDGEKFVDTMTDVEKSPQIP